MTSQVTSSPNSLSLERIRSRLLLFFLVCTIALTGYTLVLQHSCNPIISWQTTQQVSRDKCNSNLPASSGIKVLLQPSPVSVEVNGEKQVKAIVEGQESSNKLLSWTSDDPKIAQVDDRGTVTGIKKGKTQIEAHSVNDNNQKAVVEVDVTDGKPRGCSPQAAIAIGTIVTVGTTALLVPPPVAFLAGSAAATGVCWLIDKVN